MAGQRAFKGGNQLATFSLATSESYQNAPGERVTDTQWHQVVAWGKLAGIATQYLRKGREVLVAGSDIRYIQEVLGHSSVKTPQVYTHVARQHKPVSPLDSLDLGREKPCDFGENGGY